MKLYLILALLDLFYSATLLLFLNAKLFHTESHLFVILSPILVILLPMQPNQNHTCKILTFVTFFRQNISSRPNFAQQGGFATLMIMSL